MEVPTDSPCPFKRYGMKVELALVNEYKERQLTRISPRQLTASLEAKKFLQRKPIAVMKLQTGSGSIGIIGLSAYLLRAERVMVITSSLERANTLAKSLAYPVSEATFFEKANFFRGCWTREEKNEILPRGRITNEDVVVGFDEDILFVNGSRFKGNDSVKDVLSDGFGCADLVIVEDAHFLSKTCWQSIISEYQAKRPDGKIIFLSYTVYTGLDGVNERYYGPELEAYNSFTCEDYKYVVPV